MTVPGSIWRPVKGENPYVVVAVAKMASTDEDHVVYRRVDPHDLGQTLAPVWDTTWLVPLSEWYENFVPMESLSG